MINKWAICCNKQVAFLSRGEIRPLILVRVAETRTISVMPFCRLDTRCPAYVHSFQWSKRPLDSAGGRCDHHHFYLSEQCFGTISKKYRHYSETFRHCSESEYSLYFRRLFQLPTSKNNQNSLKIRSVHWIFAFQVLILRTWSVKWCGLGRGDPPQNQWVKMDHWFLSEQYQKKSLVLFRI